MVKKKKKRQKKRTENKSDGPFDKRAFNSRDFGNHSPTATKNLEASVICSAIVLFAARLLGDFLRSVATLTDSTRTYMSTSGTLIGSDQVQYTVDQKTQSLTVPNGQKVPDPIRVWYDPRNPSEATLTPPSSMKSLLLPGLLFVVALLGTIGSFVKMRKIKTSDFPQDCVFQE